METASTHLQQFRLMGRYNTWINGRLFDFAAKLTEEERKRDMGAFFHSVHGTLNHLLLTDRHWMYRFATCTPRRFNAFAGATADHRAGSAWARTFLRLRSTPCGTDRDRPGARLMARGTRPRGAVADDALRDQPGGRTSSSRYGLRWRICSTIKRIIAVRQPTLIQQLGHDYGITDFLAMYHLAPDAFEVAQGSSSADKIRMASAASWKYSYLHDYCV